jgi:hypothetical protein
MDERRLQLQAMLEEILGSRNVYFQSPPTTGMLYPCILYRRDNIKTEFANNLPYGHAKEYQVIYIDKDPDAEDVKKQIQALATCTYERYYTADNLNHDVYKLFY